MTVTVTVDAPTLVVEAPTGFVLVESDAPAVGSPPAAEVWESGHRDQLVIVSLSGGVRTRIAELRSGRITGKPSWVLNGVGQLSWRMPSDDPILLTCLVDADSVDLGRGRLRLLGREVQWWRDGELRWAGPVTSANVNLDGVVEFGAHDHGWYTTRVVVGNAERRDLLDDRGSMEFSGLPGWSASGSAVKVRDTSVKARGDASMRIEGAGAQRISFVHPAQTVGQDTTVRLTGVVRLPSGTAAETPVFTIQAVPSGSSEVYQPSAENTAYTTSDTPLGSFVRFTASCLMRPNVTNTVTVTLWNAGVDDVWFDDVRALRNDTTGWPAPGIDLADHVKLIINHMNSKSDFGLNPVILSESGTVEPLAVRHLEHTSISDLLETYTRRSDGVDWWVDPRFEQPRFYIAARRGEDRSVPLSSRTVAAGSWVHDEGVRSSSVIVLGDEAGAERAEGGFVDTSTTAGLIFDWVERPAVGTPLSALDPLAEQIHAEQSQPATRFDPFVVPGDWVVDPGDWFPVEAFSGVLVPDLPDDGGLRVSEIAHDLDTDQLELT